MQRLSNICKYLSTQNINPTPLSLKFWAKSLLTDLPFNARIGFATVFKHRRLPCTRELGPKFPIRPTTTFKFLFLNGKHLKTKTPMSAKLGEILVRENLISPQHLRQALDYQREHGGRLGYNLVKLGLVSDDTITAVLSRQYGIPSVNLDLFDIDDSVLRLIPQEVAQKYSVLPLSRVGATLTLAMVDPTNVFAMDDIKFMTGLNVEPVVVAEASIQAAVAKYYSTSREIELATVAPDLAVESSNGNGFSHADLVSLDSLDFDQETLASEVEVFEDNEEIDLSSLTRMSEDAPV